MIKDAGFDHHVPSCAQISIRVSMIKEHGVAWSEWRWKVVGLSEVVKLAWLLLAAHFSDLPIYLIHFRDIIFVM